MNWEGVVKNTEYLIRVGSLKSLLAGMEARVQTTAQYEWHVVKLSVLHDDHAAFQADCAGAIACASITAKKIRSAAKL